MLPDTPLPYLCPGEEKAISKAVHLGRLARFYQACNTCPHRHDTATLSTRQVRQLTTLHERPGNGLKWSDEGVVGTYLNDMSLPAMRRLAGAFGMYLRDQQQAELDYPTVVVASDGRPWTSDLLATAGEGLRLGGCKVVDVGYATAPVVVFAIDHLHAAGGLFIGNPGQAPRQVGLKFWTADARPLSASGRLERLRQFATSEINRPLRRQGNVRRFRADIPYLACLESHFHALRPLKFVIDTASSSLAGYLRKLSKSVACEMLVVGRQATQSEERHLHEHLARRVEVHRAHFGVWIDGDGERCVWVDDRGREVDPSRLLCLLTKHLLEEHPRAAVVIEGDTSASSEAAIRAAGADVHRSGKSREAMDHSMRECSALVGGGPGGRFWFHDHQPAADALKALALLLNVLSTSDRDLSEVLDAAEFS